MFAGGWREMMKICEIIFVDFGGFYFDAVLCQL